MAFGEGAARNPKTRPEKLVRLAHSGNPSLRVLVAQNLSTPAASLRELAADRVPAVVVGVASNPSAPTTVLTELSRNENKDVRAAIAGNPATPAPALAEIVKARHATDVEKLAVARNPSASSSTLSDLRMSRSYGSADIHLQMQVAIASNPSASGDTLRALFRGEEKHQAQAATNTALAGNPSTPLETRAELFGMGPYRAVVLASESIQATERQVASARAATGRTAEFLAHSPDPEMRRAVALSPGAPRDVLTILANDTVPGVAAVALARITTDSSELERYAESGDPMILEGLIRNPDLPPTLAAAVARASLKTAAEDSLMILAKQTSTPTDMLHALATRPSWVSQWAASQVKQAVVGNSAAAPATLAILATDEDKTIRAMSGKAQGLPLECLVRLTADSEETVRQAAANNPATPPDLLLRLAKDDSASVVQTVAAHPEATGAVLERVVRDQLERRARLRPKSPYSRALPQFPLGPLVAAASNPNTPPDSLIALADYVKRAIASWDTRSLSESDIGKEVQVWTGIAGNPSSPADVLERVARAVHKKLWTKSDPYRGTGSLEDVRESILSKIIQNPAVSIETLQFLSDGDWVARQTTTETDREDGRTFTWTVWDDSATAAAQHDMARSVKARISQRKWRDSASTADRRVFASNPDTACGILDELKRDSDVAVRCAVAANRSTSPDALLRLAGDPATKVRLAAASATHPDSASSKFDRHGYIGRSRESLYGPGFEVLSTDDDPEVRAALVGNAGAFWEALSDSARSRMVFDSNATVRAAIVNAIAVKNHSFSDGLGLSSKALSHLIETGSPEVWRTLAGQRGELPIEILSQLAATGDPQTVASVADHHNVTHDLLLQLAASSMPVVIENVSRHVDATRHAGEADQEELVEALLANPLAPTSFLELITSKWYFERRLERVRNEAMESEPRSLLRAGDINAYMGALHRASEHANEAAARIEADCAPLHRAVRHPSFPETRLVSYAAGTDARLIRAAAQSGNARALVAAASNVNSPPEILQMLAECSEPRVRQALLENKSTPPEVLVRLIQTGRG